MIQINLLNLKIIDMGDSQKVCTVVCGPLHALLQNKPSIPNEIE